MTGDRRFNRHAKLLTLLLIVVLSRGVGAQTHPLWGNLESGPHGVGFTVVEEYDYSRTINPKRDYYGELMPGDRARAIQICIWYPAEVSSDMAMSYGEYVYTNPADERFTSFVRAVQTGNLGFFGGLAGMFGAAPEDYFNVTTGAVRDAPHADGTFPLVIYYADARRGFAGNATMCEHLASFGFVVASTHTVGATGVEVFEDNLGLATLVEDAAIITATMCEQPYVDRDQIIAIGHGLGGLTALVSAMRNSDIDAIIGLGDFLSGDERLTLLQSSPYYGAERL